MNMNKFESTILNTVVKNRKSLPKVFPRSGFSTETSEECLQSIERVGVTDNNRHQLFILNTYLISKLGRMV